MYMCVCVGVYIYIVFYTLATDSVLVFSCSYHCYFQQGSYIVARVGPFACLFLCLSVLNTIT